MLGLSGKEFERDDRFADTLPLNAEKVNDASTPRSTQRKRISTFSFIDKYRNLPLLSKIVSILASIWIIFTSMRFISQAFAGPRHRGSRRYDWIDFDGTAIEEPVAIDIMFNPTVQIGSEASADSKTSLPLYLQPFQMLDISWDQGIKGSLSIQEDTSTDRREPYVVVQTGEEPESTELSSMTEAFATSDRLFIRFKALEAQHDADDKTYNAILRVPSSSDIMPPIGIRGAEATLEIAESLKHLTFPFVQLDSLVGGFDSDNLQVGVLRVSSGTGDISGTFNVSHELDLKTSTGNITAKVSLHQPHPPHKPGKHHKHPKHGDKKRKHDQTPKEDRAIARSGKRWFWQSVEQDVERMDDFEDQNEETFDFGHQSPPSDDPHRPGAPSGPHGPPADDHRHPPPPPGSDRHPPFPPHGGPRPPFPPGKQPGHHKHRPCPPPPLRVRASSTTGNIHLTYHNHLNHAALISTAYSDTGKVHVKLAEEYKGKFKAGVKVGQVVLANERDKTLILDREIKTPTGAFVEGFVRSSSNETEDAGRPRDQRFPQGDERFAVEREFEFARMTGQGPPMGPGPRRPRADIPGARDGMRRGFFDFGRPERQPERDDRSGRHHKPGSPPGPDCRPPFPHGDHEGGPPFPHGPDGPRGPPPPWDRRGPKDGPPGPPHSPPDGPPCGPPHGPPRGPPHGPFPPPPPPGFGFSATFTTVGEVTLVI